MNISPGSTEKHLYQGYIFSLCQLATCTIVLHEYAATFELEIDVIWSRKITNIPSILFIFNRYSTIIQALWIGVLSFLSIEDERCWFSKLSVTVSGVLYLISFFTWAVFSALRVYSIGGRNLRLGMAALLLGLVPFGTNLYGTFAQLSALCWLNEVCHQTWDVASVKNDILVVTTHASLIICDILVLWITLSSTYTARRPTGLSELRYSIWRLLVRDSSLYFAFLLILNFMQIGLWVTGEFDYFTSFTLPIYSIIISRFILKLRSIYLSSVRPSSLLTQYPSSSEVQLATEYFPSFNMISLSTFSRHSVSQMFEEAISECSVDITTDDTLAVSTPRHENICAEVVPETTINSFSHA